MDDQKDTGAVTHLLEMRNIVKEFSGVRALDGVSFTLQPGEIHALVGENGAGKSTLMKVLSGVYPSGNYEGEILLGGSPCQFHSARDAEHAGIGVIYQELALVPEMNAAENIFLGSEPSHAGIVDHPEMLRQARDLLSSLEFSIPWSQPVGTMSVGQQQMVEIAKACRRRTRILVFDEPTASLTMEDTKNLLTLVRSMATKGTGVIYISHKLEEVFALADRITVLRDGKSIETRPTSGWDKASLIGAMVGRPMKEMYTKAPGKQVRERLTVRNLSVRHPRRDAAILEEISFSAHGGETLCIAGLMGSGRTELLLSLFGAPPGPIAGGSVAIDGVEVRVSSPSHAVSLGMGLVPEDRKHQGLILPLSVLDNLALVRLPRFSKAGIVDSAGLEALLYSLKDQLGVRAQSLEMPVESLSGGNQQKVVFGKWLGERLSVMFLDEPTRGVDVGAKAELYRLITKIKEEGIAVVVVSSDLLEVVGIADRVLVMREGRLTGELTGDNITQERIMELAA